MSQVQTSDIAADHFARCELHTLAQSCFGFIFVSSTLGLVVRPNSKSTWEFAIKVSNRFGVLPNRWKAKELSRMRSSTPGWPQRQRHHNNLSSTHTVPMRNEWSFHERNASWVPFDFDLWISREAMTKSRRNMEKETEVLLEKNSGRWNGRVLLRPMCDLEHRFSLLGQVQKICFGHFDFWPICSHSDR